MSAWKRIIRGNVGKLQLQVWQEELLQVLLDVSWLLVPVLVLQALPWALAPLAQQVGIGQHPLR